jgi:hypothetical protein
MVEKKWLASIILYLTFFESYGGKFPMSCAAKVFASVEVRMTQGARMVMC